MARNVTLKPNPIDFHVGQRNRARRRELGFSQTVLGNEIGVSFKQVQKYKSVPIELAQADFMKFPWL